MLALAAPSSMRSIYAHHGPGSSTSLAGEANTHHTLYSNLTKSPLVQVTEGEKPVASANGVSCYINLAEPHVYLSGFDHEGRVYEGQNATAIIRGKLVLVVAKSAKIKAVTLSFFGKARTEWPEGIPPQKTVFSEEEKLRNQVMPFYNAIFAESDEGYGAQCNYVLKGANNSSSTSLALDNDDSSQAQSVRSRSSTLLSGKDMRRLSLQATQSRSFQKGESPYGPTPQQKGYKIFHPGRYEYSFEISLDQTSPETMELPLGSVHWMLEALVERAGTFKPNLHGTKEVQVIRAPDSNSLEQVEPIAISRKWEDQLHYDIVISGKSFPIGSKIPIAFKLTPLAKVQCHRIKVFVTENIDYYCMNKKVTRRDAQRKILLLERQAGKPISKDYAGSNVNIIAGGERSASEREMHRRMAEARRRNEAQRQNREPEPLPAQTENLLGDLDLGLEHLVYQTEIEMDVQLPTCATMAKDRSKIIHPDVSWKNIQVHHWIKIVMRLSRLDADDPSGTKRRHFEISIDSPFHILSCLATQAHTSLPEYSDLAPNPHSRASKCGCMNADSTNDTSPASSDNSVPTLGTVRASSPANGSNASHTMLPPLTIPAQAHLAHSGSSVQRPQLTHIPGGVESHAPRPMHLLRAPSFNPPPFEAEEPPPPAQTPPPMYDHVIGTPSHDGLADYFARLADYDDEHSEDEDRSFTRSGRVNVLNPRTPGGRAPSRSMDISREFMFRPEGSNSRLQSEREGGEQERVSPSSATDSAAASLS